MIAEDRDDWQREVLCIGAPEYIRELEARVLAFLDAAADPQSFNQYNNDLKFFTPPEVKHESGKRLGSLPRTEEWRRKISESKRGKKRRPFSDEWRAKLIASKTGRKRSDDFAAACRERKLAANNNLWEITTPEGEVFLSNSLKAWCDERFGALGVSAASNMRHKPYKGYTARKINPSSSSC